MNLFAHSYKSVVNLLFLHSKLYFQNSKPICWWDLCQVWAVDETRLWRRVPPTAHNWMKKLILLNSISISQGKITIKEQWSYCIQITVHIWNNENTCSSVRLHTPLLKSWNKVLITSKTLLTNIIDTVYQNKFCIWIRDNGRMV